MNCFVIGNGGWGTALGMVLAGNGHDVTIWGPFEEEINAIRETGENTVYHHEETFVRTELHRDGG